MNIIFIIKLYKNGLNAVSKPFYCGARVHNGFDYTNQITINCKITNQ